MPTAPTPAAAPAPAVGPAADRSVPARVRRRLEREMKRAAFSLAKRGWIGPGAYDRLGGNRFARERRAVFAGRLAHDRSLRGDAETPALLRRNTHRLEKGLLMRPRRPVFAADYVFETVDCYAAVVAGRRKSEGAGWSPPAGGDLAWSRDVLTAYFAAVEPGRHDRVDAARAKFEAAGTPAPDGHTLGPGLVPYRRELGGPPPVSYDQLHALAVRRRSVRWFLDEPVPREKLDAALAVAAQAPSACNRQPFQFRIFDAPELVRKVIALPMGTAGWADNVPVFVVIVGRLRNYPDPRDRHVIYVDGALAAMSFAFALETLGLSGCCVNWPDVEDRERAMAELLSLDPDERPVMCMAVGVPDPDGLVAYSQKKPPDDLRRYN